MSSGKAHFSAYPVVAMFAAAALLTACIPAGLHAREFEASVAPEDRFLFKVYPKFFFTSAYFADDGRAYNLPGVTGLLYFELPLQVQYGITGSLSVGAILPIGWTYQEEEEREDPLSRLTVRECWLTIQHRWLTFPFVSSSSVRIKVPLADKKEWEDGLRIGDGQVDIFPIYHFDYFSTSMYWFVQFSLGYKYRFKKGDYKPLDELRFYARGGYELFPELRMRFYLYADLTEFSNGEYPAHDRKFFQHDGALHTFGYGVSLWPRPTFRVEMTTGGNWSGRNQYRGIRWIIGVTKIF